MLDVMLMARTLATISISILAACGDSTSMESTDAGAFSGDGGSTSVDGASPDLVPAPQLRWSFENNVTNDGVSVGHELERHGGSGWEAGKVGYALMLSSGYVGVEGMQHALGAFSDVTIAFWLKETGNLESRIVDIHNRSTLPYGGLLMSLLNGNMTVCVASTSNLNLPSGDPACDFFQMPSPNAWHHWIVRYDGSGVGPGQGGATTFYVDGNLAYTVLNDEAQNPVWSAGIRDVLTIEGYPHESGQYAHLMIDELTIWNRVFTPDEQCTLIVGGRYSAGTCAPR